MDTPDILDLKDQLDQAEQEAQKLVADLTEQQGVWQPAEHSWSIAQCLDHLARTNGIYLEAMRKPAIRAHEEARFRRRPALPGFLGRWFVKAMEPPVKARSRMKAPRAIEPGQTPSLMSSFADFKMSQTEVHAFVDEHSDLDLASVKFPNPFVRGVRFSLATGLHVITAHERRHLWQAWDVRRSLEGHDQ